MSLYKRYIKRILDVATSLLCLLLMSPFLLLIGFLIKKEDKGEVFYRGIRVGKGGKIFKIIKFRTMVVNAEEIGGSSTADDDPRITRIGRQLRNYKIDELPQLINVLKGDMSFVGPRPQVPWAVDTEDIKTQKIISVRPGITDYASIHFHNEGEILKGLEDPDKGYFELIHPKKVELELEYVDNIKLSTDVIIIIRTIGVILKKTRGEHDYECY